MNTLAQTWPAGASATAPTFDLSTFRNLGAFATSAYADPAAGLGPFATVKFYDNTVTAGQADGIDYNTSIDANGDGKMWLVAKGATGDRVAGIQAEVNRTPVNTNFPHGVAVYTGGDMTSNGGGNNPKIVVEDKGTAASVTGYVSGSIDTASVFDTNVITVPPSTSVPPLSSLIPDEMINQVIALAQSLGRYYDTTKGDPIPADKSGICVIRVADGTSVALGNNGSINTLAKPGVLMILGPEGGSGNAISIDIGGNETFYGVLYTDGHMYSAHGTPDLHGMVICKSNLDMKGTPRIRYNDSVITNLANQWTLTVNLVPNTWREISASTTQ